MPNTLDATGLTIKTQLEILADIETDQRLLVDPDLDVSAETPLGQINGILSGHMAELLELLAEVYDGQIPTNALNATLDGVASISGTRRLYAAPTKVSCTINVDALFTADADTLIGSITGDPTVKFRNETAISNGLGSPANIEATFVAEVNGAQEVGVGQLSVISSPVTGWNSIVNLAAESSLGRETETDSELSARREANLAAGGDTTVDAIRTALLDGALIAGVLEAAVVENDTESTDALGIASKSFESVLRGGDDAEVAAIILSRKPAGIRAVGNSTETVYDAQGNPHVIGFTRPSNITVYIVVTLDMFPLEYGGDEAIKESILAWTDANNRQGLDVMRSRISAESMKVPGVKDVVLVQTGTSGVASVDLTIAHGEIADYDISRIVIVSAEASEP